VTLLNVPSARTSPESSEKQQESCGSGPRDLASLMSFDSPRGYLSQGLGCRHPSFLIIASFVFRFVFCWLGSECSLFHLVLVIRVATYRRLVRAACRKVAGSMLQRYGCHVTPVAGGEEAVETFRNSEEPFHMILMDLQVRALDQKAKESRCKGSVF
jgi:hypothetical protein